MQDIVPIPGMRKIEYITKNLGAARAILTKQMHHPRFKFTPKQLTSVRAYSIKILRRINKKSAGNSSE